ncbi:MAG: hypothetical protein ACO39C_08705, partial [Chthoniobacterales bacterium]
ANEDNAMRNLSLQHKNAARSSAQQALAQVVVDGRRGLHKRQGGGQVVVFPFAHDLRDVVVALATVDDARSPLSGTWKRKGLGQRTTSGNSAKCYAA